MKVLLIEDHEGFAVIVGEMLRTLDEETISFEWASRLDQGIECVTRSLPDIILLDLALPDSCGLDTLIRIQQHARATPIIVLTGTDDKQLAMDAISRGAQDYLLKSEIDRRGFVRAIRYAIERKKNELRLEYHRRKQGALHEINLAITSTLDLQSVLQALVEKVGKLLPKLAVTFWIPVNDLGEWEAVACWNLDENYWRPFWKGSASGLVKAVVGAGQPVIIEDVANDPRVSNPEMILHNKLVSHLGVPLRFKNELLGVINFFSREARQFDSEEVEFLTTLAGQLAVAIYNSRSYERAQAQAASLESAYREISTTQRKYAQLIETINAIVWEADPVTWQFTFVSKVAEEILGYPLERWLHTPDFWANQLLHPDDRKAAISRCLNEIALGNDHELEYRAVAADGRAVWLRDTVRVIKDENGRPNRLRGVMVDITKSKEAEEKQQKHYREIQSLQEVGQKVLDSGDVRDAIEKILDMAIALGGYDIGNIRLLNPEEGRDHVILRGYQDREAINRMLRHRFARPRDENWRNLVHVIATRETHVFEDMKNCDGFTSAKREGVQSLICVPITIDDDVLGVMQLGNRRLTRFEPNQLKLLETLGSQIGIVIQKAKLYEEIRAHLTHIQSMRQIEQAMVSTLSLDDVLRVLLDQIEFLFRFRVVIAVRLLRTNSSEYDTIVCRNIDTQTWTHEHERHLSADESGPAREVLNSSTPLKILRLEEDSRVRHREFNRREGLISYLGIPLRVADQVIGVLEVMTTLEHEFSEQQTDYLVSLASHAAIAIQNARLYSELGKKSQELSALLAVTAAASQSLEMERILQQVMRKISEIFGFDAMRVCLFDDQKEILHARATYETHPDFSTPSRNFKKGQGITGTVGATGEAIVISDVETDPRYEMLSQTKTALKLGHKLLAGFPIKYKEETLGVITCIGRHSRQLAVDEIQLIASMSSQIAIAIHNARLYAEVEKQSKELSALFDVTATASQSLETDRVLGEAAQKITEIFGFDATRTFLFDDQGEELHALASFASHPEFAEGPRSFKKGQGITGTVGVTGQAIIIGDVQSAPDFQALRRTEDVSKVRHPPHNFLAAFPIKYKEDTLGVILCVGRSARQLTVHEILLITAMTRQIAIAVHNARLYAEVEKQSRELSALFDVTATASQSLETKQILRQVAQKINEIFNFDATRVFLFDEGKQELRAEATHERHADFASDARRFKRGQGITGQVGSSGEAIIIGNIDTDPRYLALSYTKTAVNTQQKFLAGFPIKYKEETLGVITCVGRQPRELATHEIQLITSMSNQIAVALENARYYEQTKKQAAQLRNYANRQEAVLEQERTRISREIHDELGQALTALKLDLSLLGTKLDGNDSELIGKIGDLSSALDGAIQSVRKIATQLRPDVLDKLGLIAAIEWQLQEFRRRTGIRYIFATDITDLRLNDEHSTTLFRILQEALTNVARHARANRVKVSFELRNNEVVLRVEDDGVGVDAENLSDPNSLGLLGMRERALSLSGHVAVRRNQPKGTTVTAILPYQCSAEKVDISGSRAS